MWLQRFLEVVFLLCLATGEVIRKRVTFRVPCLPSVARRAHDGGRSDSQAQGHCSHCVPIYVSACNVRKYSKLCALVQYSYIYKGSPKASGIIPIIEMLSILLKSPKQSVPDYPSSVNPGKSTKGQYYLPGLWVDKWPPVDH